MLRDTQRRCIRYLRLSITQVCEMRCVYCRPIGRLADRTEAEMTAAEIQGFVSHLVNVHGLRKVRLTGGEPTARPDLLEIVAQLAEIDGLEELALTTNGLLLDRLAVPLARAGVDRINISLDSLDRDRFACMTGVDALERVLSGIDAAIAAGLGPVRLNTVVVRGENDGELAALIRFAAAREIEIRFIELMPMGPIAGNWHTRFVPESEMRERLANDVTRWTPLARDAGSAQRYAVQLVDGSEACVGFVTAMSCPFCDRCDRIRIAANGALFPCLMDRPSGSLLEAIRPVFDSRRFDHILEAGLSRKAKVHPDVGFEVMTQIGG